MLLLLCIIGAARLTIRLCCTTHRSYSQLTFFAAAVYYRRGASYHPSMLYHPSVVLTADVFSISVQNVYIITRLQMILQPARNHIM